MAVNIVQSLKQIWIVHPFQAKKILRCYECGSSQENQGGSDKRFPVRVQATSSLFRTILQANYLYRVFKLRRNLVYLFCQSSQQTSQATDVHFKEYKRSWFVICDIGGFRSVFISRYVACDRPVSGSYRLVCCGSDLSYEMFSLA